MDWAQKWMNSGEQRLLDEQSCEFLGMYSDRSIIYHKFVTPKASLNRLSGCIAFIHPFDEGKRLKGSSASCPVV